MPQNRAKSLLAYSDFGDAADLQTIPGDKGAQRPGEVPLKPTGSKSGSFSVNILLSTPAVKAAFNPPP
ncbi:MAG: hypothetical protein L6R45_22990 [Anaerolineae bacterium]|nr:hypothetical protein [Anaerolineae bacterium]